MYDLLKLKPIDFSINKTKTITYDDVVDLLTDCYANIAFSTFGYIFEDLSSSKSISKYNSGNCIGMSIYLKNMLKKEWGIESYLIPASIPNIYKMKGFLELSHVALFVPQRKTSYILDSSFYFLKPITIDLTKNKSCKQIITKNIYGDSIKEVQCCLHLTSTKKVLNNYQAIPKNTYYVKCNYTNDQLDTWNYYLVAIANPDSAITKFFIAIKHNPFICSHFIDENGLPNLEYYIKLNDRNITIKKGNNNNVYTPDDFSQLRDADMDDTLDFFFGDKKINGRSKFNDFVDIYYEGFERN